MGRRSRSRSDSRRGKSSRGKSSRGRKRSHSRGKDEGPRSLIVRNLTQDTTMEDLREVFVDYGGLKDCYIPKDYHSGESKCFGFVEYWDHRDAAQALREMDGEKVKGNVVQVMVAKSDRRSPRTMRRLEGDKGKGRRSRGRGDSRRRDSRRRRR